MYTLDGRIHFALTLSEKEQQMFHEEELKEFLLAGDAERFSLHFYFDHEVAQVSRGAVAEADFPHNLHVIPGNGDGLIDQTRVLLL